MFHFERTKHLYTRISAFITLNQIRYRAEVAGRQAYAHNYESVSDVRDYLAGARPPATRPAEALMTVDPSLTREEANTLADGATVPPSPVEH